MTCRQNFVINRTPTINDVSIGTKQYITDGPSLHGVVIQNKKFSGIHEWVIAGNFEMTIPKLSGRPFADAAFVLGGESYFDCGWKYSMGPFAVIIPIYQSWSNTPLINSLEMTGERVRISVSVKSFNYRNIL